MSRGWRYLGGALILGLAAGVFARDVSRSRTERVADDQSDMAQ